MSDTGRLPADPVALPDPATASNVVYNPPPDHLRELSRPLETTTEYGSPSYVSNTRSRNADRTRNAIDHDFSDADYEIIDHALDSVESEDLVCVDRKMGRHPDLSFVCRLYVPKPYGRIALAWANLFDPLDGTETDQGRPPTPDLLTIQLPEHDRTAIRILPNEGVTAVMGSDYTGEAKKSFLRLFMFEAKLAGGLGLHAGSKRVRAKTPSGNGRNVGQLFLGLSATGKSTLTAHGLGLEAPESAEMLQDDVCALLPDGAVAGSEGNGLYVKTIGLDRHEQPSLYEAVTHESAILENVDVSPDGSVDFDSDRYTTNGRAVIRRDHLRSAADQIDLDGVNQVFFITRNPLMSPVAKLTPTEAAATFMLGESIQTSAGDPSSAGESIRVVGTNPFIIGSKGEEGNRFRNLIERLDVETYVLNTGEIRDDGSGEFIDIGVEQSVTILRELARGTVIWTDESDSIHTVPRTIPGLHMDAYRVPEIVDEYDRKVAELRAERREYLSNFEALDAEIIEAV